MTVLFLKPIFKNKIWGGNKIKEFLDYNLQETKIGECWGISAHESGDSIVTNGYFKGHTLSYIWENHRNLFGQLTGDKFPLMTKLIHSNDDLSIQVHPNDNFAKLNEIDELGKTECWYIIDAEEDSKIILGHKASSKEEFENKIYNNQWDDVLTSINIKKGDFYYVPSGTVHALCKGTLVLEVQQNSDNTYRLYDYDRIDDNGELRELHVDKSLSVINIPHIENNNDFANYKDKCYTCTTFVQNSFFTVHKLDIKNKADFHHKKTFTLFNIINGHGKLYINNDTYKVSKGSNFILLKDVTNFSLDGCIEAIVSHI